MGSCGSNIADKAIQLDTPQALKDYLIDKNKKQFIQSYINEIYKQIRQSIKNLKSKKLSQIDTSISDAKKSVNDIKLSIQQKETGSINKAQLLHKKSAEQLLGLNQTVTKFENQKQIVKDRYRQVQKQIIDNIEQDYQRINAQINPSTQKLTNINKLNEADRKKSLEWGQKYAQKQIKQSNSELKSQLDKKFHFSNYQHRFDDIVKSEKLHDILEECKQNASRVTLGGSKCVSC